MRYTGHGQLCVFFLLAAVIGSARCSNHSLVLLQETPASFGPMPNLSLQTNATVDLVQFTQYIWFTMHDFQLVQHHHHHYHNLSEASQPTPARSLWLLPLLSTAWIARQCS